MAKWGLWQPQELMHTRDRISSMNSIFIALVSSCMMINSLFPSLHVKKQEYELLFDAIQSQKTVFQVCLLTEIPLQIVSSLISGGGSSAAPVKKNIPDPDNKDNSTAGEFRIVKLEKRGNACRCGQFASDVRLPVPGMVLFQVAPGLTDAPPGTGLWLLSVIFIFLLPRSSVGEDGVGVRFMPGTYFVPNL
jgi:hypothetical protein